jgi:hypothetical protein
MTYPISPHGGTGSLAQQVSGLRTYDYDTDGMAHIGLLPDFVADLKAVGVSDTDLEPLFRSAEAYLRLWRAAEMRRDSDGDGLADPVETGTGVFRSSEDTGSDPYLADTDGDGFDDGAELLAGSDLLDPLSVPSATSVPALGPVGAGALALLFVGVALLVPRRGS